MESKYIKRNIQKNHQIFLQKMASDETFFKEIHSWYWKLRIVKTTVRSGLMGGAKSNKSIAESFGQELVNKVIKERNIEFMKWFHSFFERYLLSRNWEKPLIEFIACAYYYPPETLSINIETDITKNRLVLYLDPEVSQNELYNSWPVIKEELSKLKRGKRKNFSKKFGKNFDLLNKFSELRGTTEYDSDPRVGEYKLKDIDIIEMINPSCGKSLSSLKKEISRLRVIKHRANKLQEIG